MKLSVIIPCLNAANTIAVQLEALANQHWSGPWEIIVSDNGSTDESMIVAERYRGRLPSLRVVDSSDRRGAAHARNIAVKAAIGDALAFCDADDEVGIGWVAAMGDALTKYDFVACRVDFEKLNALWIANTMRHHPQQHGLQKTKYPPYLLHAGGGTLGVKRTLHEAVGGFDETLPALEDTDYCFRIQLRGAELHFVSDAVVHVRQRVRGGYNQACLWAEYNVFMYKKYRPQNNRELWRWREHGKEWKKLVRSLPRIWSKADRDSWMWQFGWQIGRLKGSIKYQVPPV